jgi:hypothetical protein
MIAVTHKGSNDPVRLDAPPGRAALRRALSGNVLAWGELRGTSERR